MGLRMPNIGIVWSSGHVPNSQHQKGQRGVLRLWDQTRKRDKLFTYSNRIKPTNKLDSSHSRAPLVLGQAMGNTGLTQLTTARTRGKPPPFPIQYYLQLSTKATSEWHFFPGLSRRSPETIPVWTPGTLGIHNVLLKPQIGMRSEAILQFSLRVFQRHVALLLQTSDAGRFQTFSGRESNCQFDSRPFFCP